MQSLLTGYVRGFNREHRRRGHLFQGRYKAIVCDREGYLLELVRYIHLNPVRAGLVKRPFEWKWSGHGEYLKQENRGLIDCGPVMEEFRTVGRYEAFIREGIGEGYRAEWNPGESTPVLGTEEFVRKVVGKRKSEVSHRPVSKEDLLNEVAKESGLALGALKTRGRSAALVKARRRFIQRAILEQGYKASDVAGFLGFDAFTISRVLKLVRD